MTGRIVQINVSPGGVPKFLVNLDHLGRDRVRFAALPLKLEGGDGAPARAIAILD